MYQIKSLNKDNFLMIYKLNHNIFSYYESYNIETIKDFCDKGSGYIIEVDNKIIGYVLFGYIDSKFMIISLGIISFYRNKGYGKLLLKHCIKCQSTRPLYLNVRNSNLIALKLYKSLDFKLVKLEPNFYNNEDGSLLSLN